MIDKRILPETFDFGVPSVEIIDAGRSGMDKTAMLKRASAFDDIVSELKPEKGHTYLHVITTGSMEKYGSNRNGDAFNEDYSEYVVPYPEKGSKKVIQLNGGLHKFHDSSYMSKKAAVYQEHKSKEEPSGHIVAAKYNDDMHRGELIIAVDNDKWARRLNKKASGQDIYLSMGCSVPYDICGTCGHMAKVASEHCKHFTHMKGALMDDGTRNFVINDSPRFYDISGVDVPADRIAYVLRKVASDGVTVKEAAYDARCLLGVRTPMVLTKSAGILQKLSKLEKKIDCMIEGDNNECECEEALGHDSDAGDMLVRVVKDYPSDEVIDCCSRNGILLSPSELFRIMGRDVGDGGRILMLCGDDSCGDCSNLLRELEESDDVNDELLDGSFDQHFIPDMGLERLVSEFIPMLSMRPSAVGNRVIRITISGGPICFGKTASVDLGAEAQHALRRTYARYLVSFAEQNDEATCFHALRKCATFGRTIRY